MEHHTQLGKEQRCSIKCSISLFLKPCVFKINGGHTQKVEAATVILFSLFKSVLTRKKLDIERVLDN